MFPAIGRSKKVSWSEHVIEMTLSDKSEINSERQPLLRDPVWSSSHRYTRGRIYDPQDLEELLALDSARNQRFHWLLFLSVTFVSILLLLATMGVLIRLSQTHPSFEYSTDSTTQFPLMVSPNLTTIRLPAQQKPTEATVEVTSVNNATISSLQE